MSELPHSVREITDKLDAVGNTTAAIAKGFAIGSAALTALALFASYAQVVKLEVINLLNPLTLAGVLLGAMIPFLFSALTMEAAEIPGSYTADISGITFNIPSMEDDQQLSIRLDVTLSNGQFLTAPGGTFSFLNGEMVSSVG